MIKGFEEVNKSGNDTAVEWGERFNDKDSDAFTFYSSCAVLIKELDEIVDKANTITYYADRCDAIEDSVKQNCRFFAQNIDEAVDYLASKLGVAKKELLTYTFIEGFKRVMSSHSLDNSNCLPTEDKIEGIELLSDKTRAEAIENIAENLDSIPFTKRNIRSAENFELILNFLKRLGIEDNDVKVRSKYRIIEVNDASGDGQYSFNCLENRVAMEFEFYKKFSYDEYKDMLELVNDLNNTRYEYSVSFVEDEKSTDEKQYKLKVFAHAFEPSSEVILFIIKNMFKFVNSIKCAVLM